MTCNCQKDFPWEIGDKVEVVRRFYWHPQVKVGSIGTISSVGYGIHQIGFWLVAVDFEDGTHVSDMSVEELTRVIR